MHHQQFNSSANSAILFLHGANAGGWMWDNVIHHLPNYHCISVDFPGHGKSNSEPWTYPEHVAGEVVAIVQQLNLNKPIHLVGFSLGGYVALHVLSQQAHLFEKVIISGVPSKAMPYRYLTRVLGIIFSPFIHTDLIINMSARALAIPEQALPDFHARLRENPKQAFRRINQQAVNFVPPQAALLTTNSKLFLAGQKENSAIKNGLYNFADPKFARNSTSAKVAQLGHGWVVQDPKLFAATTSAWIENLTLPERVKTVG